MVKMTIYQDPETTPLGYSTFLPFLPTVAALLIAFVGTIPARLTAVLPTITDKLSNYAERQLN